MSENILSKHKNILPNEKDIKKILSKQKNLAIQFFKTIEDLNLMPSNKRNNE